MLNDFLRQKFIDLVRASDPLKKGNIHPLIMSEVERQLIMIALEEMDYNIFKTAKILGIGRNKLYRKIDFFAIDIKESKSEIRLKKKSLKKVLLSNEDIEQGSIDKSNQFLPKDDRSQSDEPSYNLFLNNKDKDEDKE